METEKQLQDYIMKECKKRNILCHKLESRTSCGWPDLILMYNGESLFIDVKSPSGTGNLSALQVWTIADIQAHCGWVEAVDSKVVADTLIEELLEC